MPLSCARLAPRNVGAIVLFCALAAAALMPPASWACPGRWAAPMMASALALGGAIFLAVYGWQALRRARRPQQLRAAEAVPARLLPSWRRRRHYLAIPCLSGYGIAGGSIGAQQTGVCALVYRWRSAASCCGLLARLWCEWLAPLVCAPGLAVLDGLIGVTMCAVGTALRHALG